jgi:hypothetical protein
MDTQILVGDQSRIDRAFSGLPLAVENCQCQGTIFRSVWFVLSSCLGSILPMMVAFILPEWIVSLENAQNMESHFAWSCWIYSACGPAEIVTRSSAYAYGAASLAVSLLYSRRFLSSWSSSSWGRSIPVSCRTVRSTADYWHSLLVQCQFHMRFFSLSMSLCECRAHIYVCIQWSVDE